jgi:hypothetical protein
MDNVRNYDSYTNADKLGNVDIVLQFCYIGSWQPYTVWKKCMRPGKKETMHSCAAQDDSANINTTTTAVQIIIVFSLYMWVKLDSETEICRSYWRVSAFCLRL